LIEHAAALMLAARDEAERKAVDDEQSGEHRGGTCQQIGRAACGEKAAHSAAAPSQSAAVLRRALNQNDGNQCYGYQNLNDKQDILHKRTFGNTKTAIEKNNKTNRPYPFAFVPETLLIPSETNAETEPQTTCFWLDPFIRAFRLKMELEFSMPEESRVDLTRQKNLGID
jgi:hypothetical protein